MCPNSHRLYASTTESRVVEGPRRQGFAHLLVAVTTTASQGLRQPCLVCSWMRIGIKGPSRQAESPADLSRLSVARCRNNAKRVNSSLSRREGVATTSEQS